MNDDEIPWDEVWDEGPNAVDLVVEADAMVAVFVAQRLIRIEAMHEAARADAARYGHGLPDVVDRSIRLELAAALRITEHAAGALITRADALVHRYPAALDSLSGARITEQHATILVELLDAVEPELRDPLVPDTVALAEAQPVGVFRRRLRDLIESTREATLSERHAAALRTRRVTVQPGEDGMAWFSAYVPAVEAHAAHGRLTAKAKALAIDGDDRSLDERRADVFCDLLIDGETDTQPAAARGIVATVAVTVPALALLDPPRAADEDPRAAGSAVVEGIGPIPIQRARELCGGAKGWMRVLTHPETGMVLSVGRTQYRPPASLQRLVRWRADRCMAPGCSIPASRCQIDHSIAWEHGGSTALTNLGPLCTGHHTVKHHGGWTIRQYDDGTIEWISPSGRRYVVTPERRVPVFQTTDDRAAPF